MDASKKQGLGLCTRFRGWTGLEGGRRRNGATVGLDIWGPVWDRARQERGWVQVFHGTGGHLFWANRDRYGILQGDDILSFIMDVSQVSLQIPFNIQQYSTKLPWTSKHHLFRHNWKQPLLKYFNLSCVLKSVNAVLPSKTEITLVWSVTLIQLLKGLHVTNIQHGSASEVGMEWWVLRGLRSWAEQDLAYFLIQGFWNMCWASHYTVSFVQMCHVQLSTSHSGELTVSWKSVFLSEKVS